MQRNLYHTSPAHLAVYLNRPFHLVYQFFYDRHPKADAVIVGPGSLMFLGERLKNMLLEILPDTNPGIFNHKLVVCSPILERSFLYPDIYRAMGPVILKPVVNDIHQDLL